MAKEQATPAPLFRMQQAEYPSSRPNSICENLSDKKDRGCGCFPMRLALAICGTALPALPPAAAPRVAALQPDDKRRRYCPAPSPFYPIAAKAEAQFQLSFPSRTTAINSALAPFHLLSQAQAAASAHRRLSVLPRRRPRLCCVCFPMRPAFGDLRHCAACRRPRAAASVLPSHPSPLLCATFPQRFSRTISGGAIILRRPYFIPSPPKQRRSFSRASPPAPAMAKEQAAPAPYSVCSRLNIHQPPEQRLRKFIR